ncbi:MAG TPA: response regulator [Chryseosolibacter sp.]
MITIKQNPTCFLIDDDIDDRDFLLDALAKLDSKFTFLWAKDGAEGVRMLSSGEIIPQLILLDLNMPKMAGPECLVRLRKLPHLLATPIYIYTTAQCSELLISNMISAGARSVFMKPIRMNDLVRMMKNLIDQITHDKTRKLASKKVK